MNAHATIGTQLMKRATIEEIVGHRNRALELYAEAYQAIAAADAAVTAAFKEAAHAFPGINSYNSGHADEIKAFHSAVKMPDRDRYLRVARKLIDINVWAWIVERTDLERLMDKEAKDQLRSQMAYIPEKPSRSGEMITEEEAGKGLPEVTAENIYATLERFAMESDMIFRRGIANAFSKLERRFRSHDGFKIGSRVIVTNMFDQSGHINWRGPSDTLIDIERVFAVLDGHPKDSFRSALDAMRTERGGSYGARQSEVDTDYFKIRGFKNGNAHLWFSRDDLVEKVNKLLAEYYGEVIGDGQTQEADPFASVKTTPARYFGFFPTPEDLAKRVVESLRLYRRKGDPALRILEPSAGTGNLSRLLAQTETSYEQENYNSPKINYHYRASVDCVEIQPHLAGDLEGQGIYNRVYCMSFLDLDPATTGLYDKIVMNPPFDRERDIDHVIHALKFLKPDGEIVAIMSAGTEFRETKKARAFRDLVEQKKGRFQDLPAGSFSEVGTNVNTCILRMNNYGQRPDWYRI